MPGSGRCARCGTSLALATAVIDVHPPRAGRVSRRLPRFWGLRRTWGNFVVWARRPFEGYFAEFDEASFDASIIMRLIIPGWATWFRGRKLRGFTFLVAFLSLLLPGIVLLGTGIGSILLGAAFAVHVASAVDAMISRFPSIAERISFTAVCAVVLFLAIYMPIGAYVSRVATPIQIRQPMSEFAPGDVLWYRRTTAAVPGDLVYYRLTENRFAGRTVTGQPAAIVLPPQWISRVVAVAGQTLRWEGEQLTVDGLPIEWPHVAGLDIPRDGVFTVPAGQLIISPEHLAGGEIRLTSADWTRLTIVPQENVIGRIYFRSLPLWRMSRLD
jgi:hypothetical protein